MKYTDSVTRSFLEYSSAANRNPANINKFTDFQDPTYVGFYVRFLGIGKKPIGDEALYINSDEWPGGLLYDESHPDSAIRYLKNIGEYTRAQMLKEFIEGIKEISENMPWYFLKVSGLEEIWKIDRANSFRGKEKKITFDMLESIDLKMTYLLDLYRKATFDSVYMRHMLPENLRHFEMELVLTEIRTMQRPPQSNAANASQPSDSDGFKNPIKTSPFNINIPGLTERGLQSAVNSLVPNEQWASGITNSLLSTFRGNSGNYTGYPIALSSFDEMATFMVFTFGACEFEPFDEAPPYFANLSKFPEELATSKMTISTSIIREYNTYGLLGAIVQDTVGAAERNEKEVNSLFWKMSGKDSTGGTPLKDEMSYLEGVKKEKFVDSASERLKSQTAIKEANQRLGGLLGNLLNSAVNIGAAALNTAVQDTVANVLLGNVYSRVFPPPIAEGIAKQVTLEAPPVIKEALATAVLESNYTPKNPDAKVTQEAPNIAPATSTSVTLDSPPAQQVSLTQVQLQAPLISSAQSTSVQLTEAPVGAITAKSVILQGPPLSPPTSTNVNLTAAPISPATSTSVNLVDPPIGQASATKVDLVGTNPSSTSTGKTDLQAPPVSGLTSPNVDLEGAQIAPSNPGAAELISPSVGTSSSTSVELTEPPKGGVTATKVEFESASIKDTQVPRVELVAPPTGTQSSNRVELTEAPTNTGAVSPVSFVEPPKGNLTNPKVPLESPTITQAAVSPADLTGPNVTQIAPGKANLEGAEPSEKLARSKVPLDSPSITEVEPGKVPLDEPAVKNEMPKKVELDSPEITKNKPAKIDLTGAENELIQRDLGNSPQKSPQKPSDK